MGEAKRRGTFEHRKTEAIIRDEELELKRIKVRMELARRRGKSKHARTIAMIMALTSVNN